MATVGPSFNIPLTGTAIIHETHTVDVALFRLDHPLSDNSTIINWSPPPQDGSILEPDVENCFVLGPNFTFIPLMIFSQNQWPYKHRWTHSSVVSLHGKWIGPNGPIDIGYKIFDRLLANFEYCSRDSILTPLAQPDGTVSFGGPLICRLGSSTFSSPSQYHLFGVTIFSGPLNHTSHSESNQQRHLYFFKLSHCFRWLMASMKRNQ